MYLHEVSICEAFYIHLKTLIVCLMRLKKRDIRSRKKENIRFGTVRVEDVLVN